MEYELFEINMKKLTSFQKCEPYKSWKAQEKRNKDSSLPKHGQQKCWTEYWTNLFNTLKTKAEQKLIEKTWKKLTSFQKYEPCKSWKVQGAENKDFSLPERK